MLYLFLHPERLDEGFRDLCCRYIPEWRADIISTYRSYNDRKLSALAYLLLVKGLKEKSVFKGVPDFQYGEYGKPYLIGYEGVEFNISHCSGGVAVVVDDVPVGVDIEDVTPFDNEIAKRVCNSEEYDMVCSSNSPAHEFCRLWTMKEAVLKYYGVGIDDVIVKNILTNEDTDLKSYRLNDGEIFSVCRQKQTNYESDELFPSFCQSVGDIL
ncbi:MAG: 4'-phosphopantetheinyl transferase superfamily protein [Bacteroidales bacterium]